VPLYLVWHDPDRSIEPELAMALDSFELKPGLVLVDSALTRSRLYHRIKWALPSGTALLVAPLADAPKFKKMDAGALSWLRRREAAHSED
jgi:hypothetical protein